LETLKSRTAENRGLNGLTALWRYINFVLLLLLLLLL